MIEKLTKDQEAQLVYYRDKWLKIGLDTSVCDRSLAEKWIVEVYKIIDLPPPKIIWTNSPLGSLFAWCFMSQITKTVIGKQVREQVWKQVWRQVEEQVEKQVWRQVGEQVGKQVWKQVWEQVGKQVWRQVEEQVEKQVWRQVEEQVENFCFGSHDAFWLGFYQYFKDVIGLQCCEKLHPLMELAKNCGWWLPYKHICFCSEKPDTTCLIDGRLHCDGSAAIHYRDGFSIWALHGVCVSQEIAETPSGKLDPKLLITEGIVEVRREILRKVGTARALQKLKAKKLDVWREYELYRIEDIDIESVHILKMRCPSTDAFYTLRVPVDMTKAHDAITWVNNGHKPENFSVEA